MSFIIIGVLLGVLLVVSTPVAGNSGGRSGRFGGSADPLGSILQRNPYRRRNLFFTRSEQVLYEHLLDAMPRRHTLFAKVRLADLVEVDAQGQNYMSALGRISQKHVDFVLCDERLSPYLAVELEGKSHQRTKQQRSDVVKDRVLEAAGLPLIRYKVGTHWDLSRIQQYVPHRDGATGVK